MGNMMQGKAVIVTGAGRGIGREIALLLAAEGAKLVVNDIGASLAGEGRDASPGEETAALIRERGGEAVVNADSVSGWESAQRIVQASLDAFGRLDAVVNNAGILRDAIFHKMDEESWDAVIEVHLKGSFNVSRAAAPVFREQESGAFVHITSTSGLVGNIAQANYSAAKMGIVGLSRSIALDMARYNVRSNCLGPAAYTRMIESIPVTSPEQEALFEKYRTRMTADKNAPLAVYLASEAAKDVTGQIFCVMGNEFFVMSQPRPVRTMHRDGGWTPQGVAEVMPALMPSLTPLETLQKVFSWGPI